MRFLAVAIVLLSGCGGSAIPSLGQTVTVDGLEFTPVSASIGKAMTASRIEVGPYLLVTATIKNATTNKRLYYPEFQRVCTDEHGNTYPLLDVGFSGQIEESVSLDPGQTLTDDMVFALPVNAASNLSLVLLLKNKAMQRFALGPIAR